ncbi:hypothetical protein EW145_g2167 [Phellinidium pouzarii]|uniref:Protein kinase domain-containing protein n=1 Tax=Phellinidium pouzarii TaxID=167371 RepID=A0A4S4LCD4_9AGAM|nr:hypothetical protein EW145_g2167 [Phellinidium pouzarii]
MPRGCTTPQSMLTNLLASMMVNGRSPQADTENFFRDGVAPTSADDMRQYLQSLLDSKEKQLQKAGALGQRVLAQQMELEERVRQLQDIDGESAKVGEVSSEIRLRYRDLANTLKAWDEENVHLSSTFGNADVVQPQPSPTPDLSQNLSLNDQPAPSASQSRRAKNAARRANDVEFAFEIGSGLLTEVRRLQSILAERDKAVQDMKEEKDDLEKAVYSLQSALRAQEQNSDKFKEENWNLEVSLHEMRTQLSDAQVTAQRGEAEMVRLTKVLTSTREFNESYKKEVERLTTESTRAKAGVAQLSKNAAASAGERSNLQQSVDKSDVELARSSRLPPRPGSPTSSAIGYSDVQTPRMSEDQDSTSSLVDTTNTPARLPYGPEPSSSRPLLDLNHENRALQQKLVRAQHQISTLKDTLDRENLLRMESRHRMVEGVMDERMDDDDEDEIDETSYTRDAISQYRNRVGKRPLKLLRDASNAPLEKDMNVSMKLLLDMDNNSLFPAIQELQKGIILYKKSIQSLTWSCERYFTSSLDDSKRHDDNGLVQARRQRWFLELMHALEEWTSWDHLHSLLKWKEIRKQLQQLVSTQPPYISSQVRQNRSMLVTQSQVTTLDNSVIFDDMDEIADCLLFVLYDKSQHKKMLDMSRSDAQIFVDLLDEVPRLKPNDMLYRLCERNLRKLCGHTGLLPSAFYLQKEEFKEISVDAVASGGFGQVYRGKHKDTEVAIKVPAMYYKEKSRKFQKAEAIVWKRISHPNIVPFLGVADVKGSSLCMVSVWMVHGDLASYLVQFPRCNRFDLITGITEGLQYMHGLDIVHGDLKSVNVLVNDMKQACLADFGLSHVMMNVLGASVAMTSATMAGTYRWMAPELLRLEKTHATFESDIYSLAMVMIEVFSGQIPFPSFRDPLVIIKVMEGVQPPHPGSLAVLDWAKRPQLPAILSCIRRARSHYIPSPAKSLVASIIEMCSLISRNRNSSKVLADHCKVLFDVAQEEYFNEDSPEEFKSELESLLQTIKSKVEEWVNLNWFKTFTQQETIFSEIRSFHVDIEFFRKRYTLAAKNELIVWRTAHDTQSKADQEELRNFLTDIANEKELRDMCRKENIGVLQEDFLAFHNFIQKTGQLKPLGNIFSDVIGITW